MPAETRRLLRSRLARYLPSPPSTFVRMVKGVTLEDESLLRLLLNLNIDFESDLQRARVAYEGALPPNSSKLSLDSLIAAGWVRVAWGRISTPFDIARAASRETMLEFTSLLAKRHDQVYRLTDAARSSAGGRSNRPKNSRTA